jgi:hypothetical protein
MRDRQIDPVALADRAEIELDERVIAAHQDSVDVDIGYFRVGANKALDVTGLGRWPAFWSVGVKSPEVDKLADSRIEQVSAAFRVQLAYAHQGQNRWRSGELLPGRKQLVDATHGAGLPSVPGAMHELKIPLDELARSLGVLSVYPHDTQVDQGSEGKESGRVDRSLTTATGNE